MFVQTWLCLDCSSRFLIVLKNLWELNANNEHVILIYVPQGAVKKNARPQLRKRNCREILSHGLIANSDKHCHPDFVWADQMDGMPSTPVGCNTLDQISVVSDSPPDSPILWRWGTALNLTPARNTSIARRLMTDLCLLRQGQISVCSVWGSVTGCRPNSGMTVVLESLGECGCCHQSKHSQQKLILYSITGKHDNICHVLGWLAVLLCPASCQWIVCFSLVFWSSPWAQVPQCKGGWWVSFGWLAFEWEHTGASCPDMTVSWCQWPSEETRPAV